VYPERVISDLDMLFAPIGASAFFADYFEKQAVCLTANGARGAMHNGVVNGLQRSSGAALTRDALLAALAGVGHVPEGLLLFPEHVGASTTELVGDPARLCAYLDAGHPLVWNHARGVAPGVDALTELLSEALGAHAWPNIYATGAAGTPFDMHFDTHDVLALQCEGEKEWTISEVRENRPLDAAELEATVSAARRLRHDEAAARIGSTFTVKPGDLVYIPRGQFHNARAVGDRSLHVTFGIQLPTGFDLAKQIVLDLLGEPLLREFVPPRASDPSGARTAELLDEVAARLRAAFTAERLLEKADEVRAFWTRPEQGGRSRTRSGPGPRRTG
jgi:bifunctional lysine-specific demethylase and histidyl-hydroxylase MINA